MATLNIFRNRNSYRSKMLAIDQYLRSPHLASFRMGIITGALLIVFLVVLQGMQAGPDLIWLPLINTLFFMPGIYYTLRNHGEPGTLDYFAGLKAGALTSLVASLTYLFFILVNFTLFPDVYNQHAVATSFKVPVNGMPSVLFLFFETLIAGLVMSYCFMQFFKKE